jgi:NAD/NADP transhydrogenase beta subunit
MTTRVKWSDRDAGQKLSAVMMLVVMTAFAVFAGWSLIVDLGEGDMWRSGAAATFLVIWTVWGVGLARQLGMFDARR